MQAVNQDLVSGSEEQAVPLLNYHFNQYGFKFDESPAGDDDVISFPDFSILLDSLSYPYLYGSSLDYVEDLSGSKFIVSNPNAKTTCGCGESFTT